MKKLETTKEYKLLVNEFEINLKKLKWSLRNFFDEYYSDPSDKGGRFLNSDEIKQKYDSFRKAKSRNKINIYILKDYIEYIQNHHDMKNTQYVYANYIPLGYLDKITEMSIGKFSEDFTKKVMQDLVEE